MLPMNLSVSVQVVQALQDLLQYCGNDRLLQRSIPLVLFACVLNYVKHRAWKDITHARTNVTFAVLPSYCFCAS